MRPSPGCLQTNPRPGLIAGVYLPEARFDTESVSNYRFERSTPAGAATTNISPDVCFNRHHSNKRHISQDRPESPPEETRPPAGTPPYTQYEGGSIAAWTMTNTQY